jgi:hypothetical protein
MAKELNALEQVLVDTIQKATAVTGEAIDGVKGVTGKAIDFASAQIPDVIHQLLIWKVAESAVYIVASCIAIWLFFVLRARFKVLVKDNYDEGVSWAFFYTIAGMFLIVFPVIQIIASTLLILKIWLAPKLYLIEYVANLVK